MVAAWCACETAAPARKVAWVALRSTGLSGSGLLLGFGPWGPLCLYLLREISILVSEDSSTCIVSLDVGRLILRGTRTVETAGTLATVGLLRESSGLLLDLLVELGSSGGETPDILTNNATFLQAAAAIRASKAQRPKNPKDKERPCAARCTKPDKTSL